jgi:hypothetical protein
MSQQNDSGLSTWLPIVGAVIAIVLLVLVIRLNSDPRGTVAVKAPAGVSPVSGPDEGSVRPEKR